MLAQVLNVLSTAYSCALMAVYMQITLSSRHKILMPLLFTVVATAFQHVLISIDLVYANAVSSIGLYLLICALYKGGWALKLLNFSFMLLLVMGADLLYSSVLSLFGIGISSFLGENFSELTGIYYFIAISFHMPVGCLLSYQLFSRIKRQLVDEKAIAWFVLVPIGQYYALYNMIIRMRAGLLPWQEFSIAFSILVLFVAADFLLLRAFERLQTQTVLGERLSAAEETLRAKMERFDELKQMEENLARERHDARNRIQAALSLIADGENQQARQFLDAMENSLERAAPSPHCAHVLINKLIVHAQAKAEAAGVDLSVDFRTPLHEDCGIEAFHLFSVFSNLLDNAIEAAAASQPKTASLVCALEGRFLSLKVENARAGALLEKAGRLRSTKGAGHGYGLEIVRHIAAQYDGTCAFVPGEGRFTASCVLCAREGGSSMAASAHTSA